eukprot:TRINITY_DN635_c0_g1_i3.p2 TRINITY_DN635_c0_g1~~TRINITY_DN635_c0_g1_i3.p2  ORF type:complete len:162 (+),score=44.47 TRINITY_DN635_c0_g1_i3:312-797(+)
MLVCAEFPLPPLLAACAENDFVKVKQALQEAQARYGDSAVNSVVSQDRQTALHTVAQTGNVELARYLLSIGADVNQRDEFRRSPLHFAAAFGHHALVRLFCEKGANVNLKDNNYDSPCSVAAHRGHLDVVQILVAHPEGRRSRIATKTQYWQQRAQTAAGF